LTQQIPRNVVTPLRQLLYPGTFLDKRERIWINLTTLSREIDEISSRLQGFHASLSGSAETQKVTVDLCINNLIALANIVRAVLLEGPRLINLYSYLRSIDVFVESVHLSLHQLRQVALKPKPLAWQRLTLTLENEDKTDPSDYHIVARLEKYITIARQMLLLCRGYSFTILEFIIILG
jgi:hypothetical protein